MQLWWVLTDTSQQQLYPKQKRKNNNESDACWRVTTFCSCLPGRAARSGCLPQLNSCPLIYITNLATIEIPGLLVSCLSLDSSASPPFFVSSDHLQLPQKPIQLCLRRTPDVSDMRSGKTRSDGLRVRNRRLIEVQLSPGTGNMIH